MLKRWFAKQIEELLTEEGSPTLRILFNVAASFLIGAVHFAFVVLDLWLKKKWPDASGIIEVIIFGKILEWSSIILAGILLTISIVSALNALKQHIQVLFKKGDETDATKNDPKAGG
ncbi:hypothetical protein IH992_21080 [Candidatus Poribacteria bacterium]|nr:hypothetical protein [Candidatus Poribacteria bacterium]